MVDRRKNSLAGSVSLALGIFNLAISVAIYWALWASLNSQFGESLILQVTIFNVGTRVELMTKPLGLLMGIVGVRQKNRLQNPAVLGTVINAITILWTIAVLAQWVV